MLFRSDIFKKTKERIEKLRQISYANKARLEKDPHAIYDLEKEPAYMRLNVELDNVPHSNENQMSRLVLYEDADKKVEVRESNSFFKDQVD